MIDVVYKRDGQIREEYSFPASETLSVTTDEYTVLLYSKNPDADLEQLYHTLSIVVAGIRKTIDAVALAKARHLVAKWNNYFAQESIDDPEEAWPALIQDFETLGTILAKDVYP